MILASSWLARVSATVSYVLAFSEAVFEVEPDEEALPEEPVPLSEPAVKPDFPPPEPAMEPELLPDLPASLEAEFPVGLSMPAVLLLVLSESLVPGFALLSALLPEVSVPLPAPDESLCAAEVFSYLATIFSVFP